MKQKEILKSYTEAALQDKNIIAGSTEAAKSCSRELLRIVNQDMRMKQFYCMSS